MVLVGDRSVDNFEHFRKNRRFRAVSGGNGAKALRHGKRGADLVVVVPLGTQVYREEEDAPIVELMEHGERFILAQGGKGGRGNKHFATSVNQTPRFAEAGLPGEEGSFRLELRMIADIGIIGLPNAGKSTLLAASSSAKPKIGDYAFTTLEPQLGVVQVGYDTFLLADIPGLVPGAHEGVGLGDEFLRHISRTKALLHLVSGESEHPLEDILQVNKELESFDPRLIRLPQILVITKVDLPAVHEHMEEIRRQLQRMGNKVYGISGLTGEGVEELMVAALDLEKRSEGIGKGTEGAGESFQVFHPLPVDEERVVTKDDGVFVLEGPHVPNLVVQHEVTKTEYAGMVRERLRRTRWRRALEHAGIKAGDKVRVREIEIVW